MHSNVYGLAMQYRLLVALVIFIPSMAYASFPDVPTTHPNFDAIQYLQNREIVKGFSNGSFRPNQKINRVEFLKIVIEKILHDDAYSGYFNEALPECLKEGSYGNFSDVPKDTWFTGYVCFAQELTLIQGYPDNTFRPDTSISFSEAASILSNPTIFTSSDLTYPDAPNPSVAWFKYPIDFLAMNYAIPTSISSISQYITRGEMAEMIYRLQTKNIAKPSRTFEDLKN